MYDGGAGVARIYLNGNLVDVHADDGTGSDGKEETIAESDASGISGNNDGFCVHPGMRRVIQRNRNAVKRSMYARSFRA